MKIQKSDTITVRLNPCLKQKLEVAKWFLNLSDIIWVLIQDYVRDFEKQYWVIPVSIDKNSQYDIVTKMYWVKMSPERFDELLHIFPKVRNNIAVYWK